MSQALAAKLRTATGRRSKTVSKTGEIPSIVYGGGTDPQSVQVSQAEFRTVYKAAGGSALVDLSVNGGTPVKVLIKDVQVNHLNMKPIHVDFMRIRMDQKMTAEIPLRLVGESAAVKGLAGTLVQSMHEVKVSCLPNDLPHEIDIDISALATFEDSITVADLKLPKGVEVLEDALASILTVVPPLTDEQLKKMEEGETHDVTAVKTEGEEKKAAEAAKKAEEEAAAGKPTK